MSRKIKSVQIERHNLVITDMQSDELKFEAQKYKFTEYDEHGNITTDITYGPDGSIEEKIENTYDENNNLVEEVYYDEEGSVAEKRTFEYNQEKKPETEYKHYLDGSKDITTCIYDNSGNLIKKVTKDEDDVVERTEYLHYQDKQIIKKEVFDEDNEKIISNNYQYDKNGKLIEAIIDDDESMEYYKMVYEYDDDGNRLKSLKYEDDRLTEETSFKTDDKGRVTKVIEKKPLVLNTIHIGYDQKGNAIRQEEFNENEELNHSVERRFDEEGNILETKVFIDLHGQGINQNYILKYDYEFY